MPEAAGVVLKLTPADMQTERQQSAAGRCAGFTGRGQGRQKERLTGRGDMVRYTDDAVTLRRPCAALLRNARKTIGK